MGIYLNNIFELSFFYLLRTTLQHIPLLLQFCCAGEMRVHMAIFPHFIIRDDKLQRDRLSRYYEKPPFLRRLYNG